MPKAALSPAPPEFIARLKQYGLQTPQELETALNAVGHTHIAHLEAGGDPAADQPAPKTESTEAKLDRAAADMWKPGQGGGDIAGESGDIIASNPVATAPTQPSQPTMDATPAGYAGMPPQAQPTGQMPQGFQIPNLKAPDYTGAEKATTALGQAQANQSQTIGEAQNKQANDFADMVKIQQDAEFASRDKINKAIEMVRQDPRNEWSGFKHVTAGIAAVLGGMGGAFTGGGNVGIDVLNKQIDRQVGLNKDYVAHLEQQYGDAHQANLAARVAFRDNAMTQIDSLKNVTQNPVIKANADLAKNQLQIQQQKDVNELHLKETELGINRLRYQREMMPFSLPGYKDASGNPLMATSTEGAAKINQFKSGYDAVKPLMQKLQHLATLGPKASPMDIADAKNTALAAQNQMRLMEGQGVFKEGTAKFDAKMIPDNVNDWIPWHTKGAFQKQLQDTMGALDLQEKGLLGAHVLNYQGGQSGGGRRFDLTPVGGKK